MAMPAGPFVPEATQAMAFSSQGSPVVLARTPLQMSTTFSLRW